MGRYQPKPESLKRVMYMGDHGPCLTDFSPKNAFSDDNSHFLANFDET